MLAPFRQMSLQDLTEFRYKCKSSHRLQVKISMQVRPSIRVRLRAQKPMPSSLHLWLAHRQLSVDRGTAFAPAAVVLATQGAALRSAEIFRGISLFACLVSGV